MTKILLGVVGVLVAAGGTAALWVGYDKFQDADQLGMDIYNEKSEMAYGKGPARREQGQKKIADWEKEIDAKKTESYIWFGAGPVAIIAGATLALLPWLGKRKRPGARPAPEPAQSADAAGDGPGQ